MNKKDRDEIEVRTLEYIIDRLEALNKITFAEAMEAKIVLREMGEIPPEFLPIVQQVLLASVMRKEEE